MNSLLFRLSAAFCTVLLAGSAFPSLAQSHRIVRLSAPDAINPAEVSIAINPANPDQLVAVSLQYGTQGQPRVTNVAYRSTDGGRTWTTQFAQNPDGRVQGDDAVRFDANGNLYHSYIAFDGIRVTRPEIARNGIFVRRSEDGGQTWFDPVPAIDHLNTVLPFEDKPYLAVDRNALSQHSGNVYLAWTQFDEYGSANPADSTRILFTRSTDGGRSFAMPIKISDVGGNALDNDDTVEGAMPAAGVNGEVFVAWAGPRGIMLDRSLDGGLTFGNDQVIATNPGGWHLDIPGLGRANGMPVTAVDHSEGPHRGTLYVTWADERHGDADVFLTYSRDGGTTWAPPVRVNDDAVGNGAAQFFTWLAVDPADGSVNLVFYDRRGLTGTETAVTLARSLDGGQTFVNHRLNLPPFRCNRAVFFGDYNGLDAFGGRVVPVFTHFLDDTTLAVSAALFDFVPGTQRTR